jgi:hypothetical protein
MGSWKQTLAFTGASPLRCSSNTVTCPADALLPLSALEGLASEA